MRERRVKCRWLDRVSSIAMMIRPRAKMAVPKIYELMVVHPADGLGLAERANRKGHNLPPTYRTVDTAGRLSTNRRLGRCSVWLFQKPLPFELCCCGWNRWALFSSPFSQSSSFFKFSVFNIPFIIRRNVDEWNVMSQVETVVVIRGNYSIQAHIRHCGFVDDQTASTIDIHISCACSSIVELYQLECKTKQKQKSDNIP